MQQIIIEIIFLQKEYWTTTSEKKVVSAHLPLEKVIIKVQNSKVIASPFKKINAKYDENRNANLKDIKGLQQQNNFTNQILGIIATQMDRFEKNMPKVLPTKSDYDKPFFKPLEIAKPIKFGNNNKNEELHKILAKKLEAKQQINYLSGTDSESLNNDNESEISNFSKKIDDDLQINRITSQKFQIGMSGELEFSSPIFRLKMGILFDIAFVLLSNFLALVFHTKKT